MQKSVTSREALHVAANTSSLGVYVRVHRLRMRKVMAVRCSSVSIHPLSDWPLPRAGSGLEPPRRGSASPRSGRFSRPHRGPVEGWAHSSERAQAVFRSHRRPLPLSPVRGARLLDCAALISERRHRARSQVLGSAATQIRPGRHTATPLAVTRRPNPVLRNAFIHLAWRLTGPATSEALESRRRSARLPTSRHWVRLGNVSRQSGGATPTANCLGIYTSPRSGSQMAPLARSSIKQTRHAARLLSA